VPVAGKTTLGITIEETHLIVPGWRASKLMRSDVRNDKNKKIGKIDDLIESPDGTLSIAVIDVGGFIGVDRHRVAIPVQTFPAHYRIRRFACSFLARRWHGIRREHRSPRRLLQMRCRALCPPCQ
jgi:hypothetical protein